MSNVIIDICWTLYKSNTTFDFINYVMGRQRFSVKFFIMRMNIVKYFLVICGRILRRDLYRIAYVYLLKDIPRNDLENFSISFYEEYLVSKKIDFTFDILDSIEYRSDVILCSASLDIVVMTIAKKLNLKYVSSELEFDNNICTGFIKKDLLGNKDKVFLNKEVDLVVTDNLSDLELVKLSKKAIILSSVKNSKFWVDNNINVDFIFKE